ncbi:Hypothetical protein P9211_09831 [Prochlorococcus marinus str. MIT 9211]|uniref:Zn-ribbon protein n=1 Tax=Prochlorococcus marinus (strain MIT 9211) TaxID=93059 RepID=A9BAQ2_PROM4|nr:Hypothetical protein P9211_09831 [Prochlorococcus marinus str. MIT 9211]
MNLSIAKTKEISENLENSSTLNWITCSNCGGNGYMKTSPNCYHTCLPCLGRGLVEDDR